MIFDIPLPNLLNNSDKQNTETITEYLYMLNDRLGYMMMNIDEDNLSEGLLNTITSNTNALSGCVKSTSLPFSLSLTYDGNSYSLSVLSNSGEYIGSLTLQ